MGRSQRSMFSSIPIPHNHAVISLASLASITRVAECPLLGRSATVAADRPCSYLLSLRLFSHRQSVIHFNAKVPHGALQLGVTEEQLDSPQILCATVNQRSFGAT